ncbi:peroxisomal membrane protein PEX16-like [Entelurus aequoreus]|uniref:peroxisomal membrane protein PEX16-like n=1 Tax=Entelurus aequoreus TaxID=161455 RepID=UPI002B1DB2E4|nr:peroxisomal membrane protein PEX16-like [Entelurus aequoreus]
MGPEGSRRARRGEEARGGEEGVTQMREDTPGGDQRANSTDWSGSQGQESVGLEREARWTGLEGMHEGERRWAVLGQTQAERDQPPDGFGPTAKRRPLTAAFAKSPINKQLPERKMYLADSPHNSRAFNFGFHSPLEEGGQGAKPNRPLCDLCFFCGIKSGIQTSPPIIPLDRGAEISVEDSHVEQQDDTCFVGQRSGRVIRSLGSAPSVCRAASLKNKRRQNLKEEKLHSKPTSLLLQETIAETVYISRPLVHLLCLGLCGKQSWKPWIISAALELSSFAVLHEKKKFDNRWEREEMRRRTFILLYYLVRSPFYDIYSEEKIVFLLRLLANHVPGIGLVARPLMDYLPSWQKIYFYNWG